MPKQFLYQRSLSKAAVSSLHESQEGRAVDFGVGFRPHLFAQFWQKLTCLNALIKRPFALWKVSWSTVKSQRTPGVVNSVVRPLLQRSPTDAVAGFGTGLHSPFGLSPVRIIWGTLLDFNNSTSFSVNWATAASMKYSTPFQVSFLETPATYFPITLGGCAKPSLRHCLWRLAHCTFAGVSLSGSRWLSLIWLSLSNLSNNSAVSLRNLNLILGWSTEIVLFIHNEYSLKWWLR